MLSEDKYFQTLTEEELWQRYCGFLDLSMEGFMEIQKELLMDEIDRVADSTLGKKIMGNRKPKSVEEFRQMVPLTTYDDYEPYLSEQREDVLAIKPCLWCHSAGRRGSFRWVPYTSEYVEKVIQHALGCFILAASEQKGRVNICPGLNFLFMLPPAPYASASLFQSLAKYFSHQPIPPSDEVANLEFEQRIKRGFEIGLKDGVDVIGGLGSVLVRMGEEFRKQTRGMKFSPSMAHPMIVLHLLRAWLRSKREKRGILPKDLWPARAIVTGGMDTSIYKDAIANYWGKQPYEFYVCAEVFFLAMQAWNKKAMTFLPDSVFLEFIPCGKQIEYQDNKAYQPSTVLLNEVEQGKSYEVIVTQFYGLPLLRYRLNDIIKIVSLNDEGTGVDLPQIVIQGRVGETINLAGLVELDEKTIWQAIANTGIKYTDWTGCKEYDQNQSFLHLYLELEEKIESGKIATMIDKQLKIVDTDYQDIESYLDYQPVKVTLLSLGTFQCYMEEKRKEGADLAHLKPTRINAPEAAIQQLLQLSEVAKEK